MSYNLFIDDERFPPDDPIGALNIKGLLDGFIQAEVIPNL